MNYELTTEQINIKSNYEAFSKKEIGPNAPVLDGAPADEAKACLKKNLAALSKFGYAAMFFESEFGGTKEDLISRALAGEAIAKECASTFLSARASIEKFGQLIQSYGTNEQKKKYLPDLVRGTIIGAMAAYESDAGSDIYSMATAAAQKDGAWVLNGRKSFVANASIADAFLVFATTGAVGQPDAVITCFIVDTKTKGVSVSGEHDKMGCRGLPVCDVEFRECLVPGDAVLGAPGRGSDVLRYSIELGKVGAALGSLGISTACLEAASAHSKNRKSYGRVINRYQEVAFKLSDMIILSDLSRLMIYKALWAMETKDRETDVLASCAKVFASEAATQSANFAVQIFGGHGYMKSSPVERLYRDAKLGELIDGTSEIQRIFIAKKLVEQFM